MIENSFENVSFFGVRGVATNSAAGWVWAAASLSAVLDLVVSATARLVSPAVRTQRCDIAVDFDLTAPPSFDVYYQVVVP